MPPPPFMMRGGLYGGYSPWTHVLSDVLAVLFIASGFAAMFFGAWDADPFNDFRFEFVAIPLGIVGAFFATRWYLSKFDDFTVASARRAAVIHGQTLPEHLRTVPEWSDEENEWPRLYALAEMFPPVRFAMIWLVSAGVFAMLLGGALLYVNRSAPTHWVETQCQARVVDPVRDPRHVWVDCRVDGEPVHARVHLHDSDPPMPTTLHAVLRRGRFRGWYIDRDRSIFFRQ